MTTAPPGRVRTAATTHTPLAVAIALASTVGLTPALTACGALGSPQVDITILSPWPADEAEGTAFKAVVDEYADEHGFTVTYKGIRAVKTILEVETASGDPPDIALLSSPTVLARYIDDPVSPLVLLDREDKEIGENSQWLSRVEDPEHVYGVTVKTDLKSLIWYSTDTLASAQATTWSDLLEVSADLRDREQVTPWCIGVKDSSDPGWTGTDWIEDILLHQSGASAYQQWATGHLAWTSPEVTSAWTAWGDLLAASGMDTPEAAEIILKSTWSDANAALVGASETLGTCALEHQASFVPANLEAPSGLGSIDYFPFPSFASDSGEASTATTALELSVDVAGLFSDSPEARQLLCYLASAEGQSTWARKTSGRFFSPRADLDRESIYGAADTFSRRIADQIAASGQTRCLDASDYMPSAVSRAFSAAVLEFIADPDPGGLPAILERLDEVRVSVSTGEWLSSPCSP